MQESNKLTKKEYWNNSWKKIKLPTRFFCENYSHILLTNLISKFISNKYKSFLKPHPQGYILIQNPYLDLYTEIFSFSQYFS